MIIDKAWFCQNDQLVGIIHTSIYAHLTPNCPQAETQQDPIQVAHEGCNGIPCLDQCSAIYHKFDFQMKHDMMASSHGNAFFITDPLKLEVDITGPLWGESTT